MAGPPGHDRPRSQTTIAPKLTQTKINKTKLGTLKSRPIRK